jgi:RimJ/RimL family protein N-acetyltransferase
VASEPLKPAMSRVRVRPLTPRDQPEVLSRLERSARLNLFLIDLALRMEDAAPSRSRGELLGAFRDEALIGVASVHPSLVLDATAEPAALAAFFPHLGAVASGLVKSTEPVVTPLYEWLENHGRQIVLDRIEHAFALDPVTAKLPQPPRGVIVRSAETEDLPALIEASRASLLEEDRPDPTESDPGGFRRWVAGRVKQAVVAEERGRVGFVGYADVQCSRGWLIQGVYTWPSFRRRGLARAGVAEICRRAFAAEAEHVQLAVVDGNTAAIALYELLGFVKFARLRTVLFG